MTTQPAAKSSRLRSSVVTPLAAGQLPRFAVSRSARARIALSRRNIAGGRSAVTGRSVTSGPWYGSSLPCPASCAVMPHTIALCKVAPLLVCAGGVLEICQRRTWPLSPSPWICGTAMTFSSMHCLGTGLTAFGTRGINDGGKSSVLNVTSWTLRGRSNRQPEVQRQLLGGGIERYGPIRARATHGAVGDRRT